MSTTVLEALKNAQINFETLGKAGLKMNPIFMIASEQLSNAVKALEDGHDSDFVLQNSIFDDINK